MVLLERLSSNNFENFKILNLERFSNESYDKNFFEYYDKEKFLLKIFLKKFVKLFIYNKKVIGYIWYEVPIEIPIRIWSLYIKPEYLNVLSPNILNSFNNTVLSYEACDDEINNKMLSKLGFRKVRPSILMNMHLRYYNKLLYIDEIILSLKNNNKLLETLNSLYNYNFTELNISIDKFIINKEEDLRCKLQNSIFSSSTRVPLEIVDIKNDIEQDYYIEDLALFIRLNDIAIGYGQIIYNRNMYTVVNFGLIKEFQAFGLGKVLLNSLIQKLKNKGVDELFIRVEDDNYNAFKLYNWIGFTPKSIINRWER